MKFYKIQILSILTFISIASFAQKTYSYEGPFVNGLPMKSEVRYSYYLDARGKQVKHGGFRYLVKEKIDDRRLNHNFSGSYANGLKDGDWDYVIKSRNYTVDAQGYYESSEIQLDASYVKGVPHGEWNYYVRLSRRKKEVKNGKTRWLSPELTKDVKIKLHFNHGILVDSLIIKDALSHYNLDIWADNEGFVDGMLQLNMQDKPLQETYQKGVKKNSDEKKNQHLSFYLKHKSNASLCFHLDTSSVLGRKELKIKQYLLDNVFNTDYFLFYRIGGDKAFNLTSKGKIAKLNINGFYTIRVSACITDAQQKILSDIAYYSSKVALWDKRMAMEVQKSPLDKDLKKRSQSMHTHAQYSNKVLKAAQLSRRYFLPQELLNSSRKIIGEVPVSIRDAKDVNAYLLAWLQEAKRVYEVADKLSK
jgi:hypothetical protein